VYHQPYNLSGAVQVPVCLFPLVLGSGFQSFLVGGLIVVLIGAALIPGLPAVVKLTALALTTLSLLMYIHMMPDLEFMLMLISDVVFLGFAAWFAILFLRK